MTKGIVYGVREDNQESMNLAAELLQNPPSKPVVSRAGNIFSRLAGKLDSGHESIGFELVFDKTKISAHVGLDALMRYALSLREIEICYLDNPIYHSQLTSIEHGINIYCPEASSDSVREEERKAGLYADSQKYYGIREAKRRANGDYRVSNLKAILQKMYVEHETERVSSINASILHAAKKSNPWAYFLRVGTAERLKENLEKNGFSVSII